MNRSEIVEQLSELYPALKSKQIEVVVKNLFNMMVDCLIEGQRIEIRGFASFALKKRSAGKIRNPRDGIMLPSEERSVVYFRAGKELKDRVNTPHIAKKIRIK